MGYRRQAKRYRLAFEGADYDGLEVVMAGVSTGEYLDMADGMSPDAPRESMEAVLSLAASKIVRWNLEDDDGIPVPATVEGLRSLDFEFVSLILSSWMSGMVAVPPPLPGTSNGGGSIPPGSIPMESLSPSLPS